MAEVNSIKTQDVDHLLISYIGFQIGNTNNPDYDGEYFAANEDVIVVTAK